LNLYIVILLKQTAKKEGPFITGINGQALFIFISEISLLAARMKWLDWSKKRNQMIQAKY